MTNIDSNESPVLTSDTVLQITEKEIPFEQNSNILDITGSLCIHRIVEAYARHKAENLAVVDEKEHITYHELNSRANHIAHHLRRLGNTSAQPVGIYMEQSIQTIISMLAVLKAGSSYVPIDTHAPPSRVATILEEAGISIVLTQKNLGVTLAGTPYTVVDLDKDWQAISQESSDNISNESSERDLAYIIFTSGTTGKPKGVEIEHRSLYNLICWHQQAFQITALDRATLFASISFDASVWETWPYLCSGASVFVVPTSVQNSLTQLQRWLIDQKITISFLPTPLAEQMIKLEWPSTLALRTLLTGGDRLHTYPPATLPFTFVNNYGPTENTVVTTSGVVAPDPDSKELPTLGKPITNVEVYLLDEQLQPVASGEVGEIYIAGASLARGYRNQPQLTRERFLPHPFSKEPDARLYKTGDLARWDDAGQLIFLGRNDQQVKIRGFRIELGEIQAKLGAYTGIHESSVVAVPVSDEEYQLNAFFVPNEQIQISVDDLRTHLKTTLPDYMIPAKFVQLDSIPHLPSGKVDLQQLVAMSAAQMVQKVTISTSNKTEQLLVEIWSDLLKGHQFGLEDDFFKIGGHSLSVLQLIIRVRQSFGVSITVRDIFQSPTITKLASVIEKKQLAKGAR